ncbi:MAG: tRNA uridine(34) 5-carboxymethylaminomethyl modification radical SAM/GNAT enzyme Elp3 [Chloroflexi bacterium]|nr:tRNA uridine(34) 5-carboxymethylaminomethyl modification radical SAM/GNAT enzyme Elp3 [Chloroflexota bacterium]
MRSLPPEKMAQARRALEDVRLGKPLGTALREHSWNNAPLHKSALVAVYQQLVESGEWEPDEALLAAIRLKPVRTLSGVTTVTVLTKPYPCPGKCIFCPDDERMPKSYLPDEPGAMRALEHNFDPYTQVQSRLEALTAVGHPTDKIELLILGGTFSSYRRDYQAWFVKQCFEALNDDCRGDPHRPRRGCGRPGAGTSPAPTLAEIHSLNEFAPHRNVGLVVETRPDEITPDELAWFRALGVTKVQMGVQSLDDPILELNQRGHTVAEAHRAVALLRAAGFKIVLHWMPNLLGATPESDRADFPRLWEGLCPDEIKIYPTQLLENAPLYEIWKRGEYRPYTTDELIHLIADVKPSIPRYCRVNRIIRDIPSTHVVEGNKRTSLRQDVHVEMARRGAHCDCIRCREVRGGKVKPAALRLDDLVYHPDGAEEHFLSFVTPEDQIAGFLRLSLPGADSPVTGLADLDGAAIIREVHVYGQSLAVGTEQSGAAQHTGLGTRLLAEADNLARAKGYRRMVVIAAVGTRQYYLERGFERGVVPVPARGGELYLRKSRF